MLYDIEVRPGPDTGFFQYYTETVEANTSHDAIKKVQRANRGCQVRCCASYNAPNDTGSSTGIGDMGQYLGLGVVLLVIWLLVEFWWIVIPVSVIGGILWWFGKD